MKTILLSFIISISVFAQGWTPLGNFPNNAFMGNLGGHGVAVDPNGKVWCTFYGATDSIWNGSIWKACRAIYVFNADGSAASFSPIKTITIGGITDTLYNTNRGLRADNNGNILLSSGDILYRINYQTGQGMRKVQPTTGMTLTTVAVDANGNIFAGPVVQGNPIQIFTTDFTFIGNVVDATVGFSRTLEVSHDGNTIYWTGYTNNQVYIYSRASEFDPFALTDSLLQGFACESVTWSSDGNLLWFSSGSILTPANAYPGVTTYYSNNTWYAYNPSTLTLVDSIKWVFNVPDNPDERPRGLAFSPDGNYAYATCFGISNYPAFQKFMKNSSTSVNVTTPNGGENWQVGSSHNIYWTSNGITNVKLEYTTNNGSSWITIIGSTPSDGSYSWTLPNTPSTQCKVKVSDVTNSSISDVSNNFYTISTTFNPCPETPTVLYQGKLYNTVQIGSQCWLKENLDVGTMILGTQGQSNNGVIEKYCYDDNPANCITYGGLYQWNEALQYDTTEGTQGICPPGWHIPSLAEFTTLCVTVDDDGNALKEIGQGTGAGAGTNTSGFSALLAGYRFNSGSFSSLGEAAFIWSSTDDNIDNAVFLFLSYNNSNAGWSTDNKGLGFSIRCIRDNLIESLNLNSPNGGENWQVGSSQNITWTSSLVTNVKLEYTTDNGSSWINIITSTPSDGNYSWTIPNTPSSNCKVKISDANNSSINDQSNNVFTISAPSITVNIPNGGESWLVGSTQNINWTSSNVSNIKIEYSTNSGVSWITVINSTASDGNYPWTIPNTASNNCRVKISNTTNLSIYDQSDNDFSIIQPSITVSSPNGGEGWQIGTVQNITWSSNNVNNVKIEYTTNNGNSWITIIGSTPSDGTYQWTIPNTQSTQSKVRLSDVSNPSVSDESNNTFSIIQFLFYALIQADSIWIDADYEGLELGLVDGSGSYISQGTITNYEWYVNNEFVANGVNPTIQLITGTSVVKLIAYNNTGLSASDSINISVYAAKLSTNGAILSGISQYGNNFYVTSMNNGVYRIDSTGSIKQSYITGGSIQSSLCISNQTGLMYVGSTDTRLYCFDTGLNSMWDKGLGGVVNNSASVNYNGEVVYVGANDNNTHLGFLKSLVASNGNAKWTFQADGTILSSPVVMEVVDSNSIVIRTIIYFGTNKGTIYALDDLGSTYDLFWSETTNPDSAIVSSPAISSDGMIYFGSKNGYLYRFTWDGIYQSGWKKYTGGAIISSPIIDENGIVYIASSSGYVYGFDKDFTFSSDPLKRFYQNVGINGTAGIGPDGTLLVGCDNGKFFALDKNISGTDMPVKWHFQSTGPVLAPTLVTNNGIVYVGSTNGDVFIMRDPGIGGKKTSMASYEWPTFKGNNQRSKVVRLVSSTTSVQDENTIIADYNLFQNFPNPFNPSTRIKFQLPQKEFVTIKVFDIIGNEISTLMNEEQPGGIYEVSFDASDLPSGIYFYRLQAGSFVQTRKMILLK